MRKSRLSTYKQNRLIELFVAGVTARVAAKLVCVNKTTAAYYFHRLRLLIYQYSDEAGLLEGEIEADESYFGGHQKGKRGRAAAGKTPVFGLLKRNGKVFVCVIPDAKSETLIPIIREKVKPDSIVYADYWREDIISLMSVSLPILESTIQNSLQVTPITSMVSRIFGVKPRNIYASLTAFQKNTSIYF